MPIEIHIASTEQDPEVLKMGEPDICVRADCPGEMGWEVGYGMAGGGMGVYHYCHVCQKVVDKMQDSENTDGG
jgi:hypothetical protein